MTDEQAATLEESFDQQQLDASFVNPPQRQNRTSRRATRSDIQFAKKTE